MDLIRHSFVLTGKMGRLRKNIISDISQSNGIYHSAIRYDTTYLVTNSTTLTVKRRKAESQGTEIITEEDLYNMIEGTRWVDNPIDSDRVKNTRNVEIEDKDTIGDRFIISIED